MTNEEAQKIAHKYIPGGAHTYSRGDDQFPSNAPKALAKGKGSYVWDVEGTKFLDYGMGLRSVGIGYDQERITNAAFEQIKNGNNLTRASEIELIAAEKFCNYIPSAEMVKFAKHGSTVTSAAVKLARAVTEKKLVLRCIDHPFFSYDDWFIGNTVINKGVPSEIQELTLNFAYNNIESVQVLFEKYKNQIACVILEPATSVQPTRSVFFPDDSSKNFLHDVQKICQDNGSLLILDEMITGFRWHNKGASFLYNIKPDLITFGKAMANGFSVAALAGKREFMERGGIHHDKERIFLTSTTHGAEMCGMGALVETINMYEELNIAQHMGDYGNKLIAGANSIATELGISDYFSMGGFACSPTYMTLNKNKEMSYELRTLFNQEMIKQKIIMTYISISYSHRESELDQTLEALKQSLKIYRDALDKGTTGLLNGPVIKPVFRRFN